MSGRAGLWGDKLYLGRKKSEDGCSAPVFACVCRWMGRGVSSTEVEVVFVVGKDRIAGLKKRREVGSGVCVGVWVDREDEKGLASR